MIYILVAHYARTKILRKSLRSLVFQTLGKENWCVLLLDDTPSEDLWEIDYSPDMEGSALEVYQDFCGCMNIEYIQIDRSCWKGGFYGGWRPQAFAYNQAIRAINSDVWVVISQAELLYSPNVLVQFSKRAGDCGGKDFVVAAKPCGSSESIRSDPFFGMDVNPMKWGVDSYSLNFDRIIKSGDLDFYHGGNWGLPEIDGAETPYCVLIPSRLHTRIGGWREHMSRCPGFDDLDYVWRLRESARIKRVDVLEDCFVIHYRHLDIHRREDFLCENANFIELRNRIDGKEDGRSGA